MNKFQHIQCTMYNSYVGMIKNVTQCASKYNTKEKREKHLQRREGGPFTPFLLVVVATAAKATLGQTDRGVAIEPSDHQLHSLTHCLLDFTIFPSEVSNPGTNQALPAQRL